MTTERTGGVEADPRVSTRMPLLSAWTDHLRLSDGRIVSVSYRWMSRLEWERSPFSSESGWSLREIGPFVVASRLLD